MPFKKKKKGKNVFAVSEAENSTVQVHGACLQCTRQVSIRIFRHIYDVSDINPFRKKFLVSLFKCHENIYQLKSIVKIYVAVFKY